MNKTKLTTILVFTLSISPIYPSWEILDLPTDRGFGAIWAINEQTIFVVGYDGLWKTFNGVDWDLDSLGGWQPSQVYFVDDTLGFLNGSTLTVDGGKTWLKGDTLNGPGSPLSFPIGQSLIGYGLGYDHEIDEEDVRKTTDGGWHWEKAGPIPDIYPGKSETYELWDICFPTPDTGYFSGEFINVDEWIHNYGYFKTTDGGQTWALNEEVFDDDNFFPRLILFPQNATVGYMAGAGKVFKTTNGGATWDTVLVDTSMSMNDMSFPETDQLGYVIGSNKAYKTTDGGETWQYLDFGADTSLARCHFIDNVVGYVTGVVPEKTLLSMPYDPGFVLKTTDGLMGIAEEDWREVEPIKWQVVKPIGSEVVLRYSNLPQGFHAQVFDATGRKVDELHSSLTSGSITWGEGKPSGVYFIRLVDADKPQSIRVVLVR